MPYEVCMQVHAPLLHASTSNAGKHKQARQEAKTCINLPYDCTHCARLVVNQRRSLQPLLCQASNLLLSASAWLGEGRMAAPPEVIKGYLILKVEEASGKTQQDQFVWDTAAGAFEAFVKGELRVRSHAWCFTYTSIVDLMAPVSGP
jgi:hypothetical protein